MRCTLHGTQCIYIHTYICMYIVRVENALRVRCVEKSWPKEFCFYCFSINNNVIVPKQVFLMLWFCCFVTVAWELLGVMASSKQSHFAYGFNIRLDMYFLRDDEGMNAIFMNIL